MPRNSPDSKPIRPQQQALGLDASAEHIAHVAELIAGGNSKQAVSVGKEAYKRHGGPAVEASLVDAYLARIASLLERGLHLEAKTLAGRVQQRHPTSRERVRNLLTPSAGKDDLNTVLQPLNDPALSPETEAAVEKFVRCHVTDLAALSQSSALSAEHPLRTASAALAKAFEAVTTGPVEEAELSLTEVSRRSPLASWKMLVRAIGAFYRHDDELCRKCLAAIEADSAASRLTPALHALLNEHKDKNDKKDNEKPANEKLTLTPAALVLVNLLGGGVAPLRTRLQKLDRLVDSENSTPVKVLNEIRDVIALCRQSCPSILERLKLHISVKAMLPVPNPEKISAALGGAAARNAYFWQLLARFFESHGNLFLTCTTWEEFRRHALREQWFPHQGVEVAALYLHMVDLLDRIPDEGFEHQLRSFLNQFRGFKDEYKGQPPEIRSVMLAPGNKDFNFLRPERLLEQVCEMDSSSENFQRWLAWSIRHPRPGRADHVAERWYAAFPNDVRPLLHLMRSAEQSNALQKAFNYMVQAERVDGLNAEVRKARLRLHVSIAIRHLGQKKARLSEQDLEAIEALPQAQQGDRPAFVAALRWVSSMYWGSQEERDRSFARVEQLLESEVAAKSLLGGVGRLCKMKTGFPTISPQIGGLPLISGAARTCVLGEDMGYLFQISPQLAVPMLTALLGNEVPPDLPGLRALGDAATRAGNRPIAYAVSGLGLRGEPAGYAQFLFLRAQSLPVWEEERYDDCLDAATVLAQRQRNHDLLDKIGAWRERIACDPPNFSASMETEQIERVIQREKNEGRFPGDPPKSKPAPSFDFEDDFDDEFFAPDPRRKPRRGGPSLPDIKEMADKFGLDVVAAALKEMAKDMSAAEKRRSKSRRGRAPEADSDDIEVPF